MSLLGPKWLTKCVLIVHLWPKLVTKLGFELLQLFQDLLVTVESSTSSSPGLCSWCPCASNDGSVGPNEWVRAELESFEVWKHMGFWPASDVFERTLGPDEITWPCQDFWTHFQSPLGPFGVDSRGLTCIFKTRNCYSHFKMCQWFTCPYG